ncbi:MAG: PLD nuclease N-terminal domain-containing protein [Anaerohalosphaeraceae bacterium]
MRHTIFRKTSSLLKIFLLLSVFLMLSLTITTAIYLFFQSRIAIQELKKFLSKSKEDKPETREERIGNSSFRYLPDGTLHLIRFRGRLGPKETAEIYDTKDHILWTGSSETIPFDYLKEAETLLRPTQLRRDWSSPCRQITSTFTQDWIFPVLSDDGRKTEYWRYDFRRNVFVGYNSAKTVLGYCSAAGFTDDIKQTRPFAPITGFKAWIPVWSFSPRAFLMTVDAVYEADFENRSLRTLYRYETAKITKVQQSNWKGLADTEPNSIPALFICCRKQPPILIVGDSSPLTLQVPDSFPKDAYELFTLNYGNGSFYLSAGWYKEAPMPWNIQELLAWHEKNKGKPKTLWAELYKIEADGTLTRLNYFEYTRPVELPKSNREQKMLEMIQGYTSLTNPACFAWVFNWIKSRYDNDSDIFSSAAWWAPIYSFLEYSQPTQPLLYYPVILLFTAAALFHALPRRTSWGKTAVWLLFVFCFNLAGFLTYLALNHYPVIRCQSCGRTRGLNRPDCPSCGAPLPSPSARDTDLIYPPSPQTMLP